MAQGFYDPTDPGNTRNRPLPDFTPNSGIRPSSAPGGGFRPPAAGGAPPGSAIDRYYEQMLKLMPNQQQQGFSDIGSLLGSFSSGEKANRVVEGNFQGGYDQMMMGREAQQNQLGLQAQSDYDRLKLAGLADQRDSETDALRKLQIGQYLQSGGSQYKPITGAPVLGSGSMPIPTFDGIAPRGATEAERTAGGELSGKMMDRMRAPAFEPTKFTPNYSYQPTNPAESYGKPGAAEKIGSYGGLIAGGLGAADMLLGGGSGGGGIGGLLSRIPGLGGLRGAASGSAAGAGAGAGAGGAAGSAATSGIGRFLGQALPIAGAVTGGMGLLKDRGLGGNVMNGVTTGASIGSIVPGLGTAVGAGIGGLVGALRGIGGGPSSTEKAGRQAAGQGRQGFTAGATPQQRQEAMASGQNPDQALMHIILRDRLGSDQAASQLVQQLHQAEKQGPEAVNRILQMLNG